MNITDTIKIKLMLKRYSLPELKAIKKFVDDEYQRQLKNTLKHK